MQRRAQTWQNKRGRFQGAMTPQNFHHRCGFRFECEPHHRLAPAFSIAIGAARWIGIGGLAQRLSNEFEHKWLIPSCIKEDPETILQEVGHLKSRLQPLLEPEQHSQRVKQHR